MALLASPQHRSSKLKNDLRLCVDLRWSQPQGKITKLILVDNKKLFDEEIKVFRVNL